MVHGWHVTVVDADGIPKAAIAHGWPAEPWSVATTDPGDVGRTLVGGVLAALDRLAVRTGNVGRLGTFLAGDDVELDLLAVADAAQVLARVVARDGSLMDEHILLGVIAVDEPVAVLDVKPLHRADDVRQDDLYRHQINRIKLSLCLYLAAQTLLYCRHGISGEI